MVQPLIRMSQHTRNIVPILEISITDKSQQEQWWRVVYQLINTTIETYTKNIRQSSDWFISNIITISTFLPFYRCLRNCWCTKYSPTTKLNIVLFQCPFSTRMDRYPIGSTKLYKNQLLPNTRALSYQSKQCC